MAVQTCIMLDINNKHFTITTSIPCNLFLSHVTIEAIITATTAEIFYQCFASGPVLRRACLDLHHEPQSDLRRSGGCVGVGAGRGREALS
jgi:hypothetical protein